MEFAMKDYLGLEGFEKLDYVGRVLGFKEPAASIAHIVDVPLDVARGALNLNLSRQPRGMSEEYERRFRLVLTLFSYLLKMADYKEDVLEGLWGKAAKKLYSSSLLHPPPWIDDGLQEHLDAGQLTALETCVDWIRTH